MNGQKQTRLRGRITEPHFSYCVYIYRKCGSDLEEVVAPALAPETPGNPPPFDPDWLNGLTPLTELLHLSQRVGAALCDGNIRRPLHPSHRSLASGLLQDLRIGGVAGQPAGAGEHRQNPVEPAADEAQYEQALRNLQMRMRVE